MVAESITRLAAPSVRASQGIVCPSAPHGYLGGMPNRILVALDDTPASQRAAEFVNAFFASADVEVVALNVGAISIPWSPAAVPGGVAVPFAIVDPLVAGQSAHDRAEERARQTVAATGIDSDRVAIAFGDADEVIEATAAEHDVDLVVVGSSDKGWWRRLLEGSVSERTVRTADRPVLVVR